MGVLPAAEWSVPFDGDPPTPLVPAIAEVEALVLGLAPTKREGTIAVPDRPRVVTILGGRGTGKSTVLQFAMRRLQQRPECLVLPVIDPETFASRDSLGGWAFALLRRELTESEIGHRVSTSGSIGSLLQHLERTQAVRSSEFLPGLEQRGLTFEEFGRDAVKVPHSGVDIAHEWAALLEAIAAARGVSGLQLVIGVDDADLAPQRLPAIVNDAQLLGASLRTVVLFAADQETLRQALEIGLLSSYGSMAGDALAYGVLNAADVRELVGRRLVKSFPRSLRIRLGTLDFDERLQFRPLGAAHSVLEVLQRFKVSTAPGFECLSDLFEVKSQGGDTLGPTDYAHCLSETARDLRQLHEALDGLDEQAPDAASRALAVILWHGRETVESELLNNAIDALILKDERGAPRLRFNFDLLEFGTVTGDGHLVYVPPEDREQRVILAPALVTRRMVQEPVQTVVTAPTEPGAEPQLQDLPVQFGHLIFLAWEGIQENANGKSLIKASGVRGRFRAPGGAGWVDEIGPRATGQQWAYWTVPEWEEYSDYFVFNAGWARAHEASGHLDRERTGFERVEFLLLTHLRLVVATQRFRRVPDDVAHLTPEQVDAATMTERWPTTRKRLVADVMDSVRAVLTEDRPDTVRARDFVIWFHSRFPLIVSPLFASPELTDELIAFWMEHVTPSERERASEMVAYFASRNLEDDLADADIALLERLDEARARRLREVRDQLVRNREGLRMRSLKELQDDFGVEHELVETIRARGASRETIVSLIAGGVPPDLATRVADLFPPPSQLAEDVSDPDVAPE
jgi:hypothetical protein